MMKRFNHAQKSVIFALVFAAAMLFSVRSYAFFGLFGGGIPVIEALSTSSELAKTISTAATKAMAEVDKKMQEIGNAYTSLSFDFLSKFGLRLPNKPTAGTKKLEIPSVANPYKEAEVKKAIYKLFLQYPSHDIPTQVLYREEAREFYDDSVIEAYSAAREVELYLATDVAAKFAKLVKNLHDAGGEGASNPEAKNEAYYNNYLAYQTIDTIARVLQEVTAIRSQLQAAKAIRDTVEPLEYDGTNNQCALWERNPELQLAASETLSSSYTVSGSINVAFAQATSVEDEGETENLSEDEPDNKELLVCEEEEKKPCPARDLVASGQVQVNVDLQDCYNEDEDMYKPFKCHEVINPNGALKFVESDDPKLEHPYYEARYKINEMQRLEFIYEKLKLGMSAHNLIKKVRKVEEEIERYKRIVMLHEKAKMMLKLVDQCSVNMLRNNFANAETVWCGQATCENIVDEEITRDGISGWALNAYAVAKAAQDEDVSPENIVAMPVEEGAVQPKLNENVKNEAEDYVLKHEKEIVNESNSGQLELAGRNAELLPWQVGAIAAKTLSENPAAWGSVSKPYPVWNDQKNFYSQYLDGKYENLPIYLQYITQGRVFVRVMPDVNEFLRDVGIKKTEKARDEAIEKINNDKKKSAADKAKEITEAKNNAKKDIEQYKKDAVTNAGLISKMQGLSDEQLFPNLKLINQPDVDISKVDLFKLGAAANSIASLQGGVLLNFSSVVSQSMGLTQATMAYIKARIEALRESMCSLGDNLYYNVQTAVKMHQDMMRELDAYEIVLEDEGVQKKVYPLKGLILALDISEDVQYFVGLKPLTAREARAPKAPASMGYAPVREIFHYDNVDVDNTKPVSAQSFLNHGGEIPEVWKVMLQPKPFVEKKFDLKKVLNSHVGFKVSGALDMFEELKNNLSKDYSLNTLLRGGTFPCNVTATLAEQEKMCIDNVRYNLENAAKGLKKDDKCGATYFNDAVLGGLDNRRNGKSFSYVGTGANPAGGVVNPCVGVTLNISGATGQIMDTSDFFSMLKMLYNEKAGESFKADKETIVNALPPSLGRSELGIFFDAYDPDPKNKRGEQYLVFRDSFLNMYDEVAKIEKIDNSRDDVLSNMPFMNNQVGAFLVAAEKEEELRKSRKELAKNIAQLEADLRETLEKINIKFSETFSFMNPDDIKLSLDTLKSLKTKMTTEVEKDIPKVKVLDNKIVKYRLREYNRLLIALNKDNGELVSIAEGVDSGPNFDEVIKMEKANLEVSEKYKEEERKAFEEALRDMSKVYCANYNEGAYDAGMCKFPE